jgi:hypothetical protein
MSAADSPGWLIANQNRKIGRQLQGRDQALQDLDPRRDRRLGRRGRNEDGRLPVGHPPVHRAQPGQVVILFDEDYVCERDLEGAFKRAGLFRYLAALNVREPLPTLAQLIRAHHNLILTDYYNRGDVVGAVAELNGLEGKDQAATVAGPD